MGDTTFPTPDENESAKWPLSFKLQEPKKNEFRRWWSHDLYRGPENKAVRVLYSMNKEESESLAKKFLDEAIVGFDMEWPWDSPKRNRLQEKVALIQVASMDKVALFHIALHKGNTTDDLIAPSLRKLIENPTIAKAGVAVNTADFGRLRKFFGLHPRTPFELSHLHRLVTFGQSPKLLTTRYVKLAELVEQHLGLPLFKGEVRTSNWTRPLTGQQARYAASDAYAGYMLFHCMNAKRVTLKPTPPLPIPADEYPTKGPGGASITPLRLYPLKQGGDVVIAADFFKPPKKEKEEAKEEGIEDAAKDTGDKEVTPAIKTPKSATKKKTLPATKVVASNEPLDAASQALYDKLSARRRVLAAQKGLPAFRVAANTILQGLARRRPLTEEELLEVKGVGKWQQATYGAHWLEVITTFLASDNSQELHEPPPNTSVAAPDGQGAATASATKASPKSLASKDDEQSPKPKCPRQQPKGDAQDLSDDSSAFGSPLLRPAQLHTGLSFTFAETNLDSEDDAAGESQTVRVERDHGGKPDGSGAETPPLVNEILSAIGLGNGSSSTTPVKGGRVSDSESRRKRKRSRTPPADRMISRAEPLTLRTEIFRNKLLAFSRLVASRTKGRRVDSGPIVSEGTLDRIVAAWPCTKDELHRIPGIRGLVEGCREADMDLLRNLGRFAPAKF